MVLEFSTHSVFNDCGCSSTLLPNIVIAQYVPETDYRDPAMNWKIWICVPITYALFSLWYFNWQGPLRQAEIDNFMTQFAENSGSEHTDPAVMRAFLEQDDGRAFIMLNQVELHGGDIAHPISGEQQPAADVLTNYFQPFALKLFLRGGHPVFQARTVGGFLDSWRADDNVGFSATAMMRYRSRRDMLAMVMDPAFADGHIYKLAAIERTINYPTQMMMNASMSPQYWVLLLLLFGASIAQNLATNRQLKT